MANSPLRVVVWATGGVGSIAIRAIHRRPELELVGVWVHSPDKVGTDAGILAGGDPIGVTATDDADELIALAPDCVVYAANAPERDAAAVPDYVKMLSAGIDVVTTSTTHLVNPAAYEPYWRDQLVNAAVAGGASLYASGIEPGFAADHLPLLLMTQSESIRTVRASEFALYDDYGVRDIMMDALGFGRPLDFDPFIAIPGAIAGEWGGQIRLIASALGVELDEIRESYDRRATDRPLDVAFGTAEAGTCGAIRIQAIGVVDGVDAIVIEHVNRLAHDVGLDWPTGQGDVSYRVVVEGEPNIDCSMVVTPRDPGASGIGAMQAGAGAMVATAMRVVNAIPYVVDAAPGLVGALDLPLTLPQGRFVHD